MLFLTVGDQAKRIHHLLILIIFAFPILLDSSLHSLIQLTIPGEEIKTVISGIFDIKRNRNMDIRSLIYLMIYGKYKNRINVPIRYIEEMINE